MKSFFHQPTFKVDDLYFRHQSLIFSILNYSFLIVHCSPLLTSKKTPKSAFHLLKIIVGKQPDFARFIPY